MPLVSFDELMDHARTNQYAVGYFESWNLESTLAVADAAEATCSPVILGFSGIYLPSPERLRTDPISAYFRMAKSIAEGLSVPACLLFNESPYFDAVELALDLGFDLVMYANDDEAQAPRDEKIRQLSDRAHMVGKAVEAELAAVPGVGGELPDASTDRNLSEPGDCLEFVGRTKIDALAVNVGQLHLHGRELVRLHLPRLREIAEAVSVPLVLHGATSIDREDLAAAVEIGVRKINVGSRLKQVFFEEMRSATAGVNDRTNPYSVLGSGGEQDVLMAGRLAMQSAVEDLMQLFGSVGHGGRR